MSAIGNIMLEKLYNTIILDKKSFILTDVMKIKRICRTNQTLSSFPFALLFVFTLSLYPTDSISRQNQPLTGVLTLELTFGSEESNHQPNFLLFRPLSVAVNGSNDIYIMDEDMVKIYDDNGNDIMTMGRRGRAPGEFYNSNSLTITPINLLAANIKRSTNKH